MAGLPREVLKWLQSLELSSPVRNCKHDLSNGFLVAEMVHAYYPHEIMMHSYDNGTALSKKVDNWEQLRKFFRKQSMEVPALLIDNTIHCKPGAANLLLQHLYAILTEAPKSQMAKIPLSFNDDEYQQSLPQFARSTASMTLKTNIATSEMIMVSDKIISTLKAKELINNHKEERRLQRLRDPERFGIKVFQEPLTDAPMLARELSAASPEPLPPIAPGQGIVDMTTLTTKTTSDGATEDGGATVDASDDAVAVPHASRLPCTLINNTALANLLDEIMRTHMGMTFAQFADNQQAMDEAQSTEGWSALSTNCVALAHESLKGAECLAPLFAVMHEKCFQPAPCAGIKACLGFFKDLGLAMVEKNTMSTWKAFSQGPLTSLMEVAVRNGQFRPELSTIFASFTGKKLTTETVGTFLEHASLTNMSIGIPMLSDLVEMVESDNDSQLIEMCVEYLKTGFESSAASVRAMSLRTLLALVKTNVDSISKYFPLMRAQARDSSFWEIRGLILLYCKKALDCLPPDHHDLSTVYKTMDYILTDTSSQHILDIGVSLMAQATQKHAPLCASLVRVLLKVSAGARAQALSVAPSTLHGIIQQEYKLVSPLTSWNSIGIARQAVDTIIATDEELESGVVDILAAACMGVNGQEANLWIEIFNAIGMDRFLTLLNTEHKERARRILNQFALIPSLSSLRNMAGTTTPGVSGAVAEVAA